MFSKAFHQPDRAVAHHLRGVYPDINEKTVRILEENEINGRTFLELTEEKLMQDGMIRGPAANISKNSKVCTVWNDVGT